MPCAFFCALVLAGIVAADAAAQTSPRIIRARNGDTIYVPAGATVTLVRIVEGRIKVATHQDGRLLIVMVDEGAEPDGSVDSYYRFELLQPYPLQYLWDGPGTVEEYEQAGVQRGQRGVGVVIPAGRILLVSGPLRSETFTADALARFGYTGTNWGRTQGTFAEVEQDAILGRTRAGGPHATVQLMGSSSASSGVSISSDQSASGGPLRVGGSVAPPRKIKDAPPVLPETARQAGVRGVVILEVIIDSLGKVRDAKVLRSIPLLDAAALEAVRQWEFTPLIVSGEPREVIMTVPVRFE